MWHSRYEIEPWSVVTTMVVIRSGVDLQVTRIGRSIYGGPGCGAPWGSSCCCGRSLSC